MHKQEAIRNALISSLASSSIRQRWQEERNLAMQAAYDKARSLETAYKNVEQFNLETSNSHMHHVASLSEQAQSVESEVAEERIVAATFSQSKCSYCGNKKHPRRICPARDVECYRCEKKAILEKFVNQEFHPGKRKTALR